MQSCKTSENSIFSQGNSFTVSRQPFHGGDDVSNREFQGHKLPKASWLLYNTATGGGIDVTVDTKPSLIRAWSSTTISTTR